MHKLYDFLESGNGYKVRLLLAHLGIPFERIEVDFVGTGHTPDDFRAVNPTGRIPAMVLDGGETLWESNAIQWYFADGTWFLPSEPLERARVLQWMFFEQYEHEPAIAVARALVHRGQATLARLAELHARGGRVLAVMEGHLAGHDYFVAGRLTIADIALYAYTHVAEEGGFDLAPYGAVRAWLDRVAAEPGHIPITEG